MRKIILAALLALASVSAASAHTVIVRHGNHAHVVHCHHGHCW